MNKRNSQSAHVIIHYKKYEKQNESKTESAAAAAQLGLDLEATLLWGTASTSAAESRLKEVSCHNSCLGHTGCHRGWIRVQGLGPEGAWRGGGRRTELLVFLDSCRVSWRLTGRGPGRASRGGAATTLLLLRRVVLPRSSPGEVSPLHELRVVHHPEGAEVVLVADETLVQWQVGADRVLYRFLRVSRDF